MQDTRYRMQDAGQIMDDLVPIGRPEGDVFIGDARFSVLGTRFLFTDAYC